MNGFLVGDASDVEKQELFVEGPGYFIIAKHLPLEHRRSEAAADGNGDQAGEEVEGRTTHDLHLVQSEDDAPSDTDRRSAGPGPPDPAGLSPYQSAEGG